MLTLRASTFGCLALAALVLTTPSAEAAPAKVSAAARAKAAIKNVAPKVGQKLELAKIKTKARLGLYRQNELVQTKTRTFHRAEGGSLRESMAFGIEGRKAQAEVVQTDELDSKGQKVGSGTRYPGNFKRVIQSIGDEMRTNMQDPDFQGATKGNKAASARWNARYDAHQSKPRPAPAPKVFVDRRGKARTLEGVTESRPNPVPRR